ncbi:MAG: PDZ domain-containing protein, partial [Ilumatobacter sp.]|nr:PDZ domain-containing protein [Ilumatobacter sp.]
LSTGQPHLKAFLGVQTVSLDAALAQRLGLAVGGGVYVEGVTAESAAEVAGIKPGDVIVSIDGTDVAAPGDIATAMSEHQPDDTVTVTVYRNGTTTDLSVVLGSHTA